MDMGAASVHTEDVMGSHLQCIYNDKGIVYSSIRVSSCKRRGDASAHTCKNILFCLVVKNAPSPEVIGFRMDLRGLRKDLGGLGSDLEKGLGMTWDGLGMGLGWTWECCEGLGWTWHGLGKDLETTWMDLERTWMDLERTWMDFRKIRIPTQGIKYKMSGNLSSIRRSAVSKVGSSPC